MKRLFSIFNTLLILLLIASADGFAANVQVNRGSENSVYPFGGRRGGMKTMLLYKASELNDAGVRTGQIRALSFKVVNQAPAQNVPLENFRVRVRHFNGEVLESWTIGEVANTAGGWTVCYGGTPGSSFDPQAGHKPWKQITFTQPFSWDGVHNILIEVAWTNGVESLVPDWGNDEVEVQADIQPTNWDVVDDELISTGMVMICTPAWGESAATLNDFPNVWDTDRSRAVIKLESENYVARISTEPNTEVYYNFVDLNRLSEAKMFTTNFFGATPTVGDLVVAPEEFAYVSANGQDFVTHPETLRIPYTNGLGDEIEIFAKIKGGTVANRNHTAKVKVTAGNLTKSINLKANCGDNPFSEYCTSRSLSTNGASITKVTIKQDDNVLIENGTVPDKKTNLTAQEHNNTGYSNNIETVPAPTLKAGEEYSLIIDRVTGEAAFFTGFVYVFIDVNRDGTLTSQEAVVIGRMGPGVSGGRIDFTMPEDLVIFGDGKVLMRIILSETISQSPCNSYWSAGETEDYAVILAPAEDAVISEILPLKTGNSPYKRKEETKLIGSLKLSMRGSKNRPAISKYTFATEGTVTPNDIKNVKLWYMGKSTVFDPNKSTLLGTMETIAAGNNTITITPEAGKELEVLPTGKSYFAITCDIKENATLGHVIDFKSISFELKNKENTALTVDIANGNPDGDKHMIKDPLSGTFYVGGNPTGNVLNYYENLQRAAEDLEILGAKGDIEFAIQGDIIVPDGQEIIFNPFEVYDKEKAKITIYPKDAPRVIKGNYTHATNITPLIVFYNVDNFVIDGRINKQGDAVGLKIINEGEKGLTSSLGIFGDGRKVLKDIIVRNTEFTGTGRKLLLSSGLFIFDAKLEEAKIQNNIFTGYSNGLYVGGENAATKYLAKTTIENNIFGTDDPSITLSISGIRLFGSSETKIVNNKFDHIIGHFPERAVNGILVSRVNDQLEVKNNTFDNITNKLNTKVSAISVVSSQTTNGLIADNIIHRIVGNGAGEETNTNLGLEITDADGLKVFHNLVYLEGNRSEVGAAADAPAVSTYSAAIFVGDKAVNVDIRNNIFVNKLNHNEDNARVKCYAIVAENNNSFFNLNNNAYFAGGTNPTLGLNTDEKATIQEWSLAMGLDKKSVYRDINLIRKDGVKFGTIDGDAAMDDRLFVPAIAEYPGTVDIHGNPRGTVKATVGIDEVIPTFQFTQQMPTEITEKCAPFEQALTVAVEVNGFSDGIEREIAGEPNFKYQWVRNGINVPNTREKVITVPADPEAEDQTPTTKVVIDTVNSNSHLAKIETANMAEPDVFTVNVTLFDVTKTSDECQVKAEGTIRITKQPVENSVLCSDSGVNRLTVGVIGTVSKYQWQKLIGNTWTDLEGDNKSYLDVTLTNEKYGVGQYRVIISDGDFDCNQGQIVSNVSTLSDVNPVSDVNLISYTYDLTEEVVVCEGKTLEIKLNRDPVTGVKGNVYGYRWEEFRDGKWVESDLEMRPYLSENGFFTEYTSPEQSGKYRLVVVGSDLCNTKEAVSNEITIKVKPFVNITEQPKSGIFCKDKSIVLSVKSEGTNPSYQWYKDGDAIDTLINSTANKARFVIDSADYEDGGHYSVIVTVDDCLKDGGDKLFSEAASVIVMNETQITKQPESMVVLRGRTATLRVESNAVGQSPKYIADYQWYKEYTKDGKLVEEKLEDNAKYSGAKANVLFINEVEDIDVLGIKYFVRVKGACSDVLKSDYVTITISEFAFTKLLQDKDVCVGDTMKLSVKAETVLAGENISYEWHFVSEGKDITLDGNGTDLTVIINPLSAGQYYAIAKLANKGSEIKSNVANVNVGVKPVMVKGLKEVNAAPNEVFTMKVEVAGQDLQYKWYRNNQAIANAASASLIKSESKAGTYKYKVVASNRCGSVESEVTVVIDQPMSNVIEEEVETGFTVSNVVPNPVVSNEAKFSVSSELGGNAEIAIVDAAGRTQKFFSGNITGSRNFTINTSKYANGAYFIVITIDGKKITRRFIVEK